MPVELAYLWGAALVGLVMVVGLWRWLRGREPFISPELLENGRSSWLTRLKIWLLSPPGATSNPAGPTRSLPNGPESSSDMPHIPAPLSLEPIRLPAAAALLGGSMLVVAGLAVRKGIPTNELFWIWSLIGLGALAFAAAGNLINQRRLPDWVTRPSQTLARFLDVSAGQLVLLLLAPCFSLLAYLAAGKLLQARHGAVATLVWLLAVTLVILGSWPFGKERLPRIGRGEWVLTAVFLLVAFLLRGTNLAGMPNTLSGDEAASGLVALAFRNGEADNLFTFGWYAFPSLYFPVQSLGIRLLGETTEALRITSAIGGALAVAVGYWLGRTLFDRFTGVLTAVYLTASHYHIHMSRIGLNNIWDSLFGPLAIMGLWHGWKTGRRSSFILTGVALGLGQYFYVSIRTLPIIFLVWVGIAFWQERDKFRQRLPGLVLAAFIAFVFVLPFGVQAMRSPNEFMAPYSRVSVFAQGWAETESLRSGQSVPEIIGGQMLATALGFTHEPLRLLYNPGTPLLLGSAAALFLMSLFWALLHIDLKYLLILLPLIFMVITGGFSHNPPASQRYVMVIPLVAMMMTLPLRLAVDWLQQLWPQAKPVLLLMTGLIFAAIVWGDVQYYFFDVYDSYVLGGGNTEVATEIAYYLRDHEIPEQQVYFFGFPRMGYFSLATISYLAPQMEGIDVNEPLAAPPDWDLKGPTLFVFLPERLDELVWVRDSYPDGRFREFTSTKGTPLFAAYEVAPIR